LQIVELLRAGGPGVLQRPRHLTLSPDDTLQAHPNLAKSSRPAAATRPARDWTRVLGRHAAW